MQPETQRPFQDHTTTLVTLEEIFSKPRLIFFLKQTVFLVIKDFVIYVYKSQDHFAKRPSRPQKYFNMNTLEAQVQGYSIIIKDLQFEECLTHENPDIINELMDVIEYNRRAIIMERLFPRRFEDLDEKIAQKKQEAPANK